MNGNDGIQEGLASTTQHGEMYVDGGGAITIDAANVPHVITTLITGDVSGVTFTANDTGAITAYADGTGKVNVTSTGHGLATGDVINITDTTNYNGVWAITKIDANSFSIPDSWVADDGASNWKRGDRLVIDIGGAGDYMLIANFSVTKAVGTSDTVTAQVYVNGTAQAKAKTIREIPGTDTGAFGVAGVLNDLSEADEVFVTIQGDNADNLTVNNANVMIHRL